MIVFLTLGAYVQSIGFYSGIIITEVVILLLPAVGFLAVFRYDIRWVLRLNGISLINLFIIFCIMIFSVPVVSIINLLNLWLLRSIFGRVDVFQPPVAADLPSLLLNILVIGVAAGVCEEVFFRGVVQRSLERYGRWPSILLTALLFGLLHADFQKLAGTFLLGALIGFIVYRTNSIFGGMFAHFTNNSIAVLLSFGVTKLMEMMDPALKSDFRAGGDINDLFSGSGMLDGEQILTFIAVWGFIFLFSASILAGLITALIRTTSGRRQSPAEPIGTGIDIGRGIGDSDARCRKAGIIAFLPGVAFIIFVYAVEGMKLLKG